ncbi:MAG TPA: hypothetical protein VEC12_01035 [Bacteroidia bacterium]|nr:hypothetical protein [Bacteroidia bacterium]
MVIFKVTGGARIGLFNATWPFAKLIVSKEELVLRVLFLKYAFKPEDIITIKPYWEISYGLKIYHKVPNYNTHIVFWTSKNTQKLLQQIRSTGFLDV